MAITGIGQAIANSYIIFVLFAYLNAVGTSAVFPLAFIIGKHFAHISMKLYRQIQFTN